MVAISDDTASAVNAAVGDVPFPFPVLSDSNSTLAESPGSKLIDNWHGLLIVDSSGRGRWLISGSNPLMEFAEVFAELNRLGLRGQSLSVDPVVILLVGMWFKPRASARVRTLAG